MIRVKTWLFAVSIFSTLGVGAQDSAFARQVVDALTSPHFWGRGYTNRGLEKAAEYLSGQFKLLGLQPIGNSYLQAFKMDVNTFPGKMELSINNKPLRPGIDFIVSPDSRGLNGKAILQAVDSVQFFDLKKKLIITLKDKLTWSVAAEPTDHTAIFVQKDAVEALPATATVQVEQQAVKGFEAYNVLGQVRGTRQPDSVMVFSAHYDHLGGMGADTYFPGANDNASGIALLLNLAKYYAAHPQPYTMVFIGFAGEEAGLVGSKYFTEYPLVPLQNIRFLVNVDLVGTGDEGITVVNATTFTKEFKLLQHINQQQEGFSFIGARGKAANSDHYWFTEKGVPSFFIYTLGGIRAYHDVYDRGATLPFTEYNDLFQMLTGFASSLMQ